MHYICSPIGSSGDIHPMFGLALALMRRGLRVTFVASGYFEELARRYGVDFVELGTKAEFLESIQHPDLWHPRRAFARIGREVMSRALRQQYEIFASLYRPGETIGIVNCFGFGGLVAQDKLGLPVVTAHMQPAVVWSDLAPPKLPGLIGPRWLRRLEYRIGERYFIDPVVCPELNAFRAELGLEPVRQITRWWHSKWCVLCLFPEWYCPAQTDWPSPLIQTSFPLWDEPNPQGLPTAVREFLDAGDPPIVFTPGSANVFGRKFFETAVAACAQLGRRGTLLTRFPEQIPSELPPTVRHFSYLPFSELLPRTAALVHHGGIGSAAQGLAAGVPQLVMPLAHDQFDNAARLRNLGVGDWVESSRFTAGVVSRKLDALLSSDDVRASLREISRRLASRDGLERTAELLDELATR